MSYIVNQLIDAKFAFTNCILFSSKCENIPKFVILNEYIIKTMAYSELVNIEKNIVGINPIVRRLCKLAFNDKIELKEFKILDSKIDYDKFNLEIKVSLKKEKLSNTYINLDDTYLKTIIKESLNGHIPTINMCYYIKLFNDEVYQIKILEISSTIKNIPITQFTEFVFVCSENENIGILNHNQNLSLFKKSINIQDLGIGGLTDEFLVIFRKVFSSRLLPKNVREELGINHVRGMLLYGPPGCGKLL
jgi:vesicle-fusing ATPase